MANKVGRPLIFQSVEDLEQQIQAYFEDCKQRKEPPFIVEMCNWLDISRNTLLDYSEGKGERAEFSDTIKRARQVCEQAVEKGMMTGTMNTTGCIFNLKNNYGWRDKIEQEHTNPDGNLKTIIINKTTTE
jgi:hypothetical protein